MEIIKRHITVNKGGKRAKTDGVVLHTSASAKSTSLFGWFSNPKAQASSHWHVAFDGTVEEYVDPANVAWANGEGNARLLSVETQGSGYEEWTPEQVESIAQLIALSSKTFGFPIRAMQSSAKSERGVGYHRLGVPASKWGVGKWLQPGGEKWSSTVGKICPGDKRIAQVDAVVARAKQIAGVPTYTPDAPKPKPVKPAKTTVLGPGSVGAKVKNLQRGLNRAFPAYARAVTRGRMLADDGSYGPATEAWVREFQRRAGLVVDGIVGPLTIAALKKYGVTF